LSSVPLGIDPLRNNLLALDRSNSQVYSRVA
jgi:hypothetical protein